MRTLGAEWLNGPFLGRLWASVFGGVVRRGSLVVVVGLKLQLGAVGGENAPQLCLTDDWRENGVGCADPTDL